MNLLQKVLHCLQGKLYLLAKLQYIEYIFKYKNIAVIVKGIFL